MKRTALMNFAQIQLSHGTEKRVNRCQAWLVTSPNWNYTILRSYDTAVAIYHHDSATLYVFDFYSRTTSQHVSKFIAQVRPMRITYLYRRSDRIIEMGVSNWANTVKLTSEQFRNLESFDYSPYISNNWRGL